MDNQADRFVTKEKKDSLIVDFLYQMAHQRFQPLLPGYRRWCVSQAESLLKRKFSGPVCGLDWSPDVKDIVTDYVVGLTTGTFRVPLNTWCRRYGR